jgi:hypothetical protein
MKLSVTSKLDGIKSWSLEALATCPGARISKTELAPVCRGCYATTGHYVFGNVKAVRVANREVWKSPTWVQQMIAALSTERYFRWFDSGDVYHPALAMKILDIIRGTPWCQHWLPTRSHKIPRIRKILDLIDAEPNAVVRHSADSFNDVQHKKGSVVVTSEAAMPEGAKLCRAYENEPAKCNGCRACWNKEVPLIAYVGHGVKMQKIIRISSPKADTTKVAA